MSAFTILSLYVYIYVYMSSRYLMLFLLTENMYDGSSVSALLDFEHSTSLCIPYTIHDHHHKLLDQWKSICDGANPHFLITHSIQGKNGADNFV